MNRRTFLASGTSCTALVGALLNACVKTKAGKIRLALDWKPEPEFGGFYAADFGKHGLMADILPGGSGTPTVQMIGAGSAEFGIVSADELVVARARGNDVVALFAVFQNCPQGIMVHPSPNLTSIGDVFHGGTVATVAIQRGLPYARILEKKFGFDKVKIVPATGGDISAFLHDRKFAQQCFVTSEPLAAMHAGVQAKVFPIADSGYNPYTTVLATSGRLLRDDLAQARAMVEAVREGWQAYLAAPEATNVKMRTLNPSMDAATFTEVAETQKAYIETADTAKSGIGTMTETRWQTLIGQLKDLGDISQAMGATECFRLL
jgi:NitT/TauT family transport system substrate-binding protein